MSFGAKKLKIIKMKNIHILPTQNNKSKLANWIYESSKTTKVGELGLQINNTVGWTNCWSERELYITSDEAIKEGDWFITKTNDVLKVKKPEKSYDPIGKKIILTTDQDLIKEGVQAINDEFLEWIVKNPSCKRVKTIYGLFNHMGRQVDPNNINQNHSQCVWKYKIIIPKEEPKQETLEEVIERLFRYYPESSGYRKAALIGKEWQQERSYSEKEVLEIVRESRYAEFRIDDLEDWFEQFKK